MTNDEALEFNKNPQWLEVRSEIDKMIAENTALLMECKPEEIKGLQQRIKDLQLMTRLPNDLIERNS